jgi:HD superfamily phosphohydrolase
VQGIDDKYFFVEDSAADTPYKPYDPDDEMPATEIYLETEAGNSREISKTREVLKQLNTRYTLLRYYFPAYLRERIDEIARTTLKRK